jgi:hypothetical protein
MVAVVIESHETELQCGKNLRERARERLELPKLERR